MKYEAKHIDFVRKHKDLPRAKTALAFNEYFGTQIDEVAVQNLCFRNNIKAKDNGRFKKGHKPHNAGTKGKMKANSGTFKKGNIPVTTLEVGAISLVEGYYKIKIAQPNKWKALHIYIWEKHNGKVPKGKCVIFKDKDTSNVAISNLMLVSRAELAVLNRKYKNVVGEGVETAVGIVRIKQAIAEAQNANS